MRNRLFEGERKTRKENYPTITSCKHSRTPIRGRKEREKKTTGRGKKDECTGASQDRGEGAGETGCSLGSSVEFRRSDRIGAGERL